jgi:hypothetical protein
MHWQYMIIENILLKLILVSEIITNYNYQLFNYSIIKLLNYLL